MTEKVFSADGEMFYEDFCDITYDMEIGDTYYVGEQVHVSPESILSMHSVNSLLEDLDCNLFDELHLDDMDDCFQDVTKEAKEELLAFLKTWTHMHVEVPYWNVKNIKEVLATQEDLE